MYLVDKKPADGTVATEVLMTQKHSVKSTVLLSVLRQCGQSGKPSIGPADGLRGYSESASHAAGVSGAPCYTTGSPERNGLMGVRILIRVGSKQVWMTPVSAWTVGPRRPLARRWRLQASIDSSGPQSSPQGFGMLLQDCLLTRHS